MGRTIGCFIEKISIYSYLPDVEMSLSRRTAGYFTDICIAWLGVLSMGTHGAAPPVGLEIYYETLCPDSIDFFANQLYPTLERIGSITNVSLIPYGIASENFRTDRYIFSCQHGARECRANIIQTCAIHLLPRLDESLPWKFIYCMMMARDPASAGPTCARILGVNFDSINDCANGKLGNELQHEMAKRTKALSPVLNWVPWVVLDGVHTDEIQRKGTTNLLKLICSAYKGIKPSQC